MKIKVNIKADESSIKVIDENAVSMFSHDDHEGAIVAHGFVRRVNSGAYALPDIEEKLSQSGYRMSEEGGDRLDELEETIAIMMQILEEMEDQ